jgi:purine-binding chemotaxis protein CheW
MAAQQYTTFRVGKYLFGLNILLIREINRNTELTKVDLTDDFILGLMNLRGEIITILDLGRRIGTTTEKYNESSRCIILKTGKEFSAINDLLNNMTYKCDDLVGLMVNEIGDIITIDDSEITIPPANFTIDLKYLSGVYQSDSQLLLLLNPNSVLND